jgi:DNA repair protein RadC
MNVTALTDAALLQSIIGIRATRRLFRGSLTDLLHSDEFDSAHRKLLAAQELVRRALREDLQRRDVLSSPLAVRDYLRLIFAAKQHEVFVGIFLDAQNRVIESEEMFRGTLTQTSVYPREIVKAVLKHNAASVIFARNHPSGIAEPSHADELLTQSLKQALALVDVKVLDHFVIAGNSALSFAERGLL